MNTNLLYSSAIDELIKYWTGAEVQELIKNNTCRQLAELVLPLLPEAIKKDVSINSQQYRSHIEAALAQLAAMDPVARQLIRHLTSSSGEQLSKSPTIMGTNQQVINVFSKLSIQNQPSSFPESEYWLRLHLTLQNENQYIVQVMSNEFTGEPREISEMPYSQAEVQAIFSAIEHRASPEKISTWNR